MKKIKVCFVSLHTAGLFFEGSGGRVGGAEVQVYYMARGLAEDPRFEVHIFTAQMGSVRDEAREDVHIHPFFNPSLPLKRVRSLWGAVRLWIMLWRLRPQICIQRAPGFESAAVALFCMVFPTRLIYMVSQEIGMDRVSHYGMQSFTRWIFLKLMVRYADAVLVQHESQRVALRAYFNRESTVRRNAFPIPVLPASVSVKDVGVLWVGRCDPWKRPEAFIECARAFPRVPFTMICSFSGDYAYFEKIKRSAYTLPHLSFHNHIPFLIIQNYFDRAIALINTSVNEGFSNTFLQAFAAGIPVISLASDPDCIIARFKLGLCAQNDLMALHNQLQFLLDNPERARAMGESGRHYLKKFHDLSIISREDRTFVLERMAVRERTPLFIEFLKYGVGGGLAFLTNFFCVFFLTDVFHIHYLVSTIVSYPIAFTVGFLFQAFVTFKTRGRLLQKLLFFLAHQSVGFALFVVLMYGFTDLLHIHYLISFIASAGMVYIFNFTFSKLLVFRQPHV